VTVSERLRALAPTRGSSGTLAGLAAAFALLAVLISAGVFTRFDQFMLDHLAISFRPSLEPDHGYSGLYRPFTANTPTSARVLDVLTYPCSALLSLLIVAGAALLLRRRFGWIVALAPVAAWTIGNVVEEIGKNELTRPALYTGLDGLRFPVPGYTDSFPSGHMIRALVVAAAIVFVWRRALPFVILWALVVAPALVIDDAHTATDVAGGILVGCMLLLLLRAPFEVVLGGSGTGTTDRSYPDPSARTGSAPRIRT